MRQWLSDSLIPWGTAAAGLLLAATLGAAQAPAYRAPRTADGRPNLNGIWQALDQQSHAVSRQSCRFIGILGSRYRHCLHD